MIAYKNTNTGQIQVFPEESSKHEMLHEWDRVENAEISDAVAEAADRAHAERLAIQAAAAIRLDTAAGSALSVLSKSAVQNQGIEAGTYPALPTMTHIEAYPTQAASLVGLLDKDNPNRGATGATPFEENRKAAEQELVHPPTTGVLQRAKDDQRAGRTQVGSKAGKRYQQEQEAAADAQRPSDAADKQQWVAYAVSKGATADAANGLTRGQLIDQYGK